MGDTLEPLERGRLSQHPKIGTVVQENSFSSEVYAEEGAASLFFCRLGGNGGACVHKCERVRDRKETLVRYLCAALMSYSQRNLTICRPLSHAPS